ncbi:MAG: isoprenyl transferase [Fibrobacterales bacterium]
MAIPDHIAIIMDGNGRWAQAKGKPRIFGHKEGSKTTHNIVEHCGNIGVNYLTLYVFSSENWQRPPKEVSFLMSLMSDLIDIEVKGMMQNNVKLNIIGRIEALPSRARKKLLAGVEKTKNNTGLQLNLAISYGSHQEILDACKGIALKVASGEIAADDIDEKTFENHLYMPDVPHPDLLIRTGGDCRVSNYLLWQIAYSEFYVTDVLWPDFSNEEFDKAIAYFSSKQRRFGKVIDTDKEL